MKRRLQQLAQLIIILRAQDSLSTGDKAELLGTCIRVLHSVGISKDDIIGITEQQYKHDPIKAVVVHNP